MSLLLIVSAQEAEKGKQAGAELCQAQFKLDYLSTAELELGLSLILLDLKCTCIVLPGVDFFYLHLITSLYLKAFINRICFHEILYSDNLSPVW